MTIQTDQPKTIKHTHLTHQDRNIIQEELEKGSSLKRIAEEVANGPSTIAKEILKHRVIRAFSSFNKGRNSCKQELTCRKNMCPGKRCTLSCRFCDFCNDRCPDYEKEVCLALKRSPHVCNGCEKKRLPAGANVTSTTATRPTRRTPCASASLGQESVCPKVNSMSLMR